MATVVIEVEQWAGEWRKVDPPVAEQDRMGSFSSIEESGREVYLFGFRDGSPGVWRSLAGVDAETERLRAVVPLAGLEQLSDLAEPFEIDVQLPRTGKRRVRFRLDP